MPTFHKLKISNLRRETEETVSIAFHVPDELREEYKYIQGQYLTLKTVIDGEDTRRSYSICSGLFDDELRVAVKKVKGGLFSSFANEVLKEGDELDVMTPMGNFYTELHPDQEHHYVGVAAGSGITPLMSIIKTILAYEPKSIFTLIYGNRTRRDIIFREDLVDLKNTYIDRFNMINILSREEPDVDLLHGRIDRNKVADILDRLIPPGGADEYYICGPETMIHDVSDLLAERKVDKKNIHFELFTSPTVQKGEEADVAEVPEELADHVAKVTVVVDGNSMEFDLETAGQNILDAALEKGADLPFACKGGVCCTCRAKLIEGEVNMDVNYSLEEDELEAGFILTCQAHPITDKVVVDFDER
ncbi:1,2-phenylacetyl-CoA epoxidase subunit PaaE [Emcibacter nanhaiensis]|uniref:Phenylacetate-CoA oxygenase/reductase subunit PaaK n=1 Tax=Emcibacter nanhaiensis TaxID=1505037 RepID=A0A501PBR3_9PROT|nr:1,2-phenylacetyl-CoA epoxidase subunit PaaE [Emcibacter nanhaiensis]TPD57813.1 phenylacetate-CoA oxygenase/reductase subunit PaaK [Emcibacter nanhaiensis]